VRNGSPVLTFETERVKAETYARRGWEEALPIKFFCERCSREVSEWDLKIVRVLAPPHVPVAIEACPECSAAIREFALATDSAVEDERHRRGRPDEKKEGGRLPIPVAASAAAALPLARGILYLGIVVLFFFLGSWLLPS
jgi:hypothetical protein